MDKTNSTGLLDKYKKIEIPIIQRDYAQGREEEKEVRDTFLNALKESLVQKTPIILDFIYGSNIEGTFQPLDGQQRLTTLFLLHWYAANKEKLTEKKELLKKFTYETRISSREFCEALVDNIGNIELKESNTSKTETSEPSKTIINTSWFFLSWKKDPTIKAMLCCLDAIHETFSDEISNLWDTQNLIQFYSIELEGMGLTDNLYIKMNARGKQLTSFENFKAEFEKHIKQNNWEENNTDITKHFAHKVDTIWTDFFWENFKKDHSIDMPLMRFMTTIAIIQLALNKNSEEKLSNNPEQLKAKHFESEKSFKYLTQCFDLYNDKYKKFKEKKAEDYLKENITEKDPSYTQIVLFFAQTEYLLKSKDKFDLQKYEDWMRVIKHIVSRENIVKESGYCGKGQERKNIVNNTSYGFKNTIQLVEKLTRYCDDIYTYLAKEEDIIHLSKKIDLKLELANTQIKEQIEEEIQKAKRIQQEPELRNIIHEIEDCELIKGKISLAFEEPIDQISKEDFEKRRVVLANYFNKDIIDTEDNSVNKIIRHALLATPRYNPETKKNEYDLFKWLYSSLLRSTYHVREIPKLTNIIDILEKKDWKYSWIDGNWILSPKDWGKNYICTLFKALETKEPDEIIEDYKNDSKNNTEQNWLYRLITEENLLNEKRRRYIALLTDGWNQEEVNQEAYFTDTKSPQSEEKFKYNRIIVSN